MSKIKCIIVDDEVHCLETLVWQLEKYCQNVEVLRTFRNPVECVDILKVNKIDLLFLDIEMPVLNGFELLKSLNSIDFELIFTTAYADFAEESAKESQIHCLLKPIDRIELVDAVDDPSFIDLNLRERLDRFFKLIE